MFSSVDEAPQPPAQERSGMSQTRVASYSPDNIFAQMKFAGDAQQTEGADNVQTADALLEELDTDMAQSSSRVMAPHQTPPEAWASPTATVGAQFAQ